LGSDLGSDVAGELTAEADLGDGVIRELDGDEDGRDHEGEDEDAVLSDLCVGDALHAAEYGVEEDEAHADEDAECDVDLEEAAEDEADAAHLSGDVGEADEDGADYGDDAGDAGVVAVADEIGDGELAELAEVRGEEEGEENVAAGPAHEVDGAVVAEEGDGAGHSEEGCGGHPVGAGGGAVDDWVDALAGDVELAGGAGAGPDRDADVEGEGDADDDECPGLNVHQSSLTPKRRSSRFMSQT